MNLIILGMNLPNPNLAILMSGENLIAGDDNGLDKATIGFKGGEFLQILPNPDVLTVGARIEKILNRR